MNPDIFNFGFFRIPPYPGLMAFAIIIGWTIGFFDVKSQGYNPWRALEVGVVSTLSGVIGARIVYVILQWDNFMMYPELIFMLRFAGLSVHGAIGGAILGAVIWCNWRNENFFRMTDFMAPYWGLGYSMVRIGCFFAGCCYGKVTDVSWAMVMTSHLVPDFLPRHPVQLYASAGAFIGFLIVLFLRRVRPFYGFLTFSAVGLYGILRFFTEFFREGETFWRGLTDAQLASIGLFIFALFAMYMLSLGEKARKKRGFSV